MSDILIMKKFYQTDCVIKGYRKIKQARKVFISVISYLLVQA